MSFVKENDVIDMMEGVFPGSSGRAGVEHEFPLQRMPRKEAMDRFGCDRPDIRFGMELVELTDIVRGCGFFGVFSKAVEAGNIVKAINCKGAGDWAVARSRSWATSLPKTALRVWLGLLTHRRQGKEPHHQVLG